MDMELESTTTTVLVVQFCVFLTVSTLIYYARCLVKRHKRRYSRDGPEFGVLTEVKSVLSLVVGPENTGIVKMKSE